MTTLPTHTSYSTDELGVSLVQLDWRLPLSNEWAQAVIAMFRQTYGERYHSAFITSPQSLQQARERTRSITILAVTPRGEVVGHAGLACNASHLGKYERAVVSEKFRGLGIGKVLLKVALDIAQRLSLELVWAEAITSRAASERLLTSFGFRPVGIHLGKFNDYFDVGCRESTVVLARPLNPKPSLVGEGVLTSHSGTSRRPLAAIQGPLYREMSQLEITLSVDATLETLKRALTEKERNFTEDYLSVALCEQTPDFESMVQELEERGFVFASQLPFSSIQRFQKFKASEWEYLQMRSDLSCFSRNYISGFLP